MAAITVNGNTINPESDKFVSDNSKGSNFIYIQGFYDLTTEEKQQLAQLHVEIAEYISERTYLCRYEPDDIKRLQELPFVKASNIYHNELKTTVSLKNMVETEADREEYEVDLILHQSPNFTSSELAPLVATKSGVDIEDMEVLPNKIRLVVHQDKLDALAELDSVNRIEEVRPKCCFNDQARTVLHMQHEDFTTLSKYEGKGQVVCVADTGFDQGMTADTSEIKVHPAFKDRVESVVSLWAGKDAHDPVGHGTHVCGSICGSGEYMDSTEGTSLSIKGIAPEAKLMVQSMSTRKVSKWVLKTPADLTSLFEAPYHLGIRIHNNSWGTSWDEKTGQHGYANDATTIDTFVCDHQDFLIMVAAGNDYGKANGANGQIGESGAAKNCVTVGAVGSTRPNDGWRYDPSFSEPSGITNTAPFSSRGPTKTEGATTVGRIKPDVVAPGVAILSAASRAVPSDDRVRVRHGQSSDKDWLFISGTSMSTPLVSGCAALLREALQEQGKQHPSAALIKALLVNGAVNYSSPYGPGFDYEQGFGRVDVDSSIAMVHRSGFVEGGSKLESTQYDVDALRLTPPVNKTWESPPIALPEGSNKLRVTLTYHDPPGALLQNDVNLIVRAGDTERHGNMGSDSGFDAINNVEKVIWEDIRSSTFTVIVQVSGFTRLEGMEQGFAVVWDVCPQAA